MPPVADPISFALPKGERVLADVVMGSGVGIFLIGLGIVWSDGIDWKGDGILLLLLSAFCIAVLNGWTVCHRACRRVFVASRDGIAVLEGDREVFRRRWTDLRGSAFWSARTLI